MEEADAPYPAPLCEGRPRSPAASAGDDAAHSLSATLFQPVGPGGAEEALYDSESMRPFVGLELGEDAIPDESTILRFRHLLERHGLAGKLFDIVGRHLEAMGVVVNSGTIVDATIIAAPPSSKYKAKARDPEMRQTCKGNEWHFGMKLHIGTDVRGIVHSVTATHAAGRYQAIAGAAAR